MQAQEQHESDLYAKIQMLLSKLSAMWALGNKVVAFALDEAEEKRDEKWTG